MANNYDKDKDNVPYHDPYDSLLQSIVNFGNDTNPTLADVWQSGGSTSSLPQQNNENRNELGEVNRIGSNRTLRDNYPFSDPIIQRKGTSSINSGGIFGAGPSEVHGQKSHPCPNVTLYDNDPFSDPMVHHMGTSSVNYGGNSEAGPSEVHVQSGHPYPNRSHGTLYDIISFSDPLIQDMGTSSIDQGGNLEAGPSELQRESNPDGPDNSRGAMPHPLWRESPVPLVCSSCTLLREITHTNGANIVKLEIHGRVGVICHAVQLHSNHVGSSDSVRYSQMFDLSEKSFEEIKIFLTKYCLQQSSSGYILMHDPLSAYYEALCVGLHWSTGFNDDLSHNPGAQTADMQQGAQPADVQQAADDEDGTERLPRTTLAEQRERAGRIKLSDFSDYFHLPIEEAAKRVNLCPTVVKKICRKEGLGRWPHRKVKANVRQISSLRKRLEIEDEATRVGTQAEIDRLQQEMIQHCGGIFPTSINYE